MKLVSVGILKIGRNFRRFDSSICGFSIHPYARQTHSSANNSDETPRPRIPKPNLRTGARHDRIRTIGVTVGTCLLAIAYMYPTIIKPMFSIGMSGKLYNLL